MHQLTISRFRSYHHTVCEFPQGIICFVGNNGAGKTNLLEAISLFSPGKGLRGGNALQWHHKGNIDSSWSLRLALESPTGPLILETFEAQKKRCITMNGLGLKHQLEVAQWISMHWITPAIDRMWNQGWWARKKYFDRIIFTLYPAYGRYLHAYQTAVQERNRALKLHASSCIFDALEESMAHNSIKIYHLRQEGLKTLSSFIQVNKVFPQLLLNIQGEFESWIQSHNAQEEALKEHWKILRVKDFYKGVTTFGPHHTQWTVIHPNQQEITSCSTGEQKSMLLALVLAWSKAIQHLHPKEFHFLLLDEVGAHLDQHHRTLLWNALNELEICVWMTGVHEEIFNGLYPKVWITVDRLQEVSKVHMKGGEIA
ncbi:DNA replication/repair protein RecF [Holospora curviuscula]|uniref:DNA replication and repair protein RecF n=1 Tax=Holospora curviuscula TaxID=1082868 RepID=A0A2S5R7A0_9PROT|nr:AAA family ATPase [Holospora curviuscula]PPE03219.1 recombination protein F [Holospora curviuscula]